jgi:hypothetical protein
MLGLSWAAAGAAMTARIAAAAMKGRAIHVVSIVVGFLLESCLRVMRIPRGRQESPWGPERANGAGRKPLPAPVFHAKARLFYLPVPGPCCWIIWSTMSTLREVPRRGGNSWKDSRKVPM